MLGFSIEISAPSWASSRPVPVGAVKNVSERLTSLTLEQSANGGFSSANITLALTQQELNSWKTSIGLWIEIYDFFQELVWEGIINEVNIPFGRVETIIGPYLDIENRTQMSYQTKRWDVVPPIGGKEATTSVLNNTDSQALYGILEANRSIGESDATLAGQANQIALDEKSNPEITRGFSFSSNNVGVVTLRCVGLFAVTEKYYYTNSNTTKHTTSTRVEDIISSDPSSRFSTNYNSIETNGLLIDQYSDKTSTAGKDLEDVVKVGDSSNNPWYVGAFKNKEVYYNAVPTTVLYEVSFRSSRPKIYYFNTKHEVLPWRVRAGQWLAFSDDDPMFIRSDAPVKEDVFIESVSFTLPFDFNVNDVTISKLGQLLGKEI